MPTSTPLRTPTLLLVDDEPNIIDLLQEEMESLDVTTLTAPNGKVALELVMKHKIDAILTDIHMPEMDGLQFLAELRNRSFETPVVILTAYSEREYLRTALRYNATDFLEKPLDPAAVKTSLSRALALAASIEQVDQEIRQMCEDMSLDPEKLAYFRKAKLRIMLMSRDMAIYAPKKLG